MSSYVPVSIMRAVGALLGKELRALPRRKALWALPPLAALIGWLMLPVNADAYITYVYDDPQGMAQLVQAHHTDVFAVHTSGLGWAQLIALVAGALLVLRNGPPAGSDRGAPPRGPARAWIARTLAQAAAAALLGVLLALADLAVVLPSAAGHLVGDRPLVLARQDGTDVPAMTGADGRVWLVVGCAVVTVGLCGVVGAGLAAWRGRWWPPVLAVGLLVPPGLLFMLKETLGHGAAATVLQWVTPVLVVPALPWALVWSLLLDGARPYLTAPAAVAVTAGLAASVLAFGLLAVVGRGRPRLRHRTGGPAARSR